MPKTFVLPALADTRPTFDGLAHASLAAARPPFGWEQAAGKLCEHAGDQCFLLLGAQQIAAHAQEHPQWLQGRQSASEAHPQRGGPGGLRHLQARAGHHRQGHQQGGDLLGGGVRGVAGQGRVPTGTQVHLEFMVSDLLFPAPGVETQQFQARMGFRVQQAGPQPHLAPRSARTTHPSAHLAHQNRFGGQSPCFLTAHRHFDERAAIAQPLDQAGFGRLADPQEERLRRPGWCVGPQAAYERPVAIEPVAQKQALGRQTSQQLAGQRLFALGQIRGRDGGGQGRVRAQFHEHRAAEFGKGGLETPAGRLGHRAEDARGVPHRELRAVDAYQALARIESLRLERGIGQGHQGRLQDGGKDFPGHRQTPCAGRGVTDPSAREFVEVGGQGAMRLADVINQPGQELPAREAWRTALARAMPLQDRFKHRRGQHPLKIRKKADDIPQTCPNLPVPQPQNLLRDELLEGIVPSTEWNDGTRR